MKSSLKTNSLVINTLMNVRFSDTDFFLKSQISNVYIYITLISQKINVFCRQDICLSKEVETKSKSF